VIQIRDQRLKSTGPGPTVEGPAFLNPQNRGGVGDAKDVEHRKVKKNEIGGTLSQGHNVAPGLHPAGRDRGEKITICVGALGREKSYAISAVLYPQRNA